MESSGVELIDAAMDGNLDTLQLLVSRGANIHQVDKYGYSALLSAALLGRMEVCKYLISLGADLMTSNRNMTALTHYGRFIRPFSNPTTDTWRLGCATTLKEWWEKGPHPSQVKRRLDEH
jgi:ankyrin repeat protein